MYRRRCRHLRRRISDLERELARTRVSGGEPIAVIGVGLRLPGGVSDRNALWDFLQRGGQAFRSVPSDRWTASRYANADPDAPGGIYTDRGAFLDAIDPFDAAFFEMSPREARHLDPQQTLVLHVAWEALEDAGVPEDRIRGSRTGIFLGVSADDYAHLTSAQPHGLGINAFNAAGSARSMVAGRLAYVLDAKGPVVAVDTSCSSSLMAVHLAAASLKNGECTLALAGGINLMLAPETTMGFCRLRALSPSGSCRAFDDAADGYVRGEGVAVVVLKRLSDARADGNRILATMLGSAANHDGRSNGLTAPNGSAQEEVIRRAMEAAGVGPDDICYVEAHGTGTPLGDPIRSACACPCARLKGRAFESAYRVHQGEHRSSRSGGRRRGVCEDGRGRAPRRRPAAASVCDTESKNRLERAWCRSRSDASRVATRAAGSRRQRIRHERHECARGARHGPARRTVAGVEAGPPGTVRAEREVSGSG